MLSLAAVTGGSAGMLQPERKRKKTSTQIARPQFQKGTQDQNK